MILMMQGKQVSQAHECSRIFYIRFAKRSATQLFFQILMIPTDLDIGYFIFRV